MEVDEERSRVAAGKDICLVVHGVKGLLKDDALVCKDLLLVLLLLVVVVVLLLVLVLLLLLLLLLLLAFLFRFLFTYISQMSLTPLPLPHTHTHRIYTSNAPHPLLEACDVRLSIYMTSIRHTPSTTPPVHASTA